MQLLTHRNQKYANEIGELVEAQADIIAEDVTTRKAATTGNMRGGRMRQSGRISSLDVWARSG